MRAFLEATYRFSGVAAGFFLVLIGALSLMQISGRLLGFAAHSFDEYASYCMAASTFLGLTWTFRCNEHIRLSLLLARTHGGVRRAMEILCLAVATGIIGFFAWSTMEMTWTSFTLKEPSQGLVPILLWIPQSSMAAGLSVMVIALLDDLIVTVSGGAPSYDTIAAPTDNTPSFER